MIEKWVTKSGGNIDIYKKKNEPLSTILKQGKYYDHHRKEFPIKQADKNHFSGFVG